MIYKTLQVIFELNENNEYKIEYIKINGIPYSYFALIGMIEFDYDAETTYFVNDLDKMYIYLINDLLANNYTNTNEQLDKKTFSYVYKGGKCSNIKIKNGAGKLFQFVSFKSKFGVEFGTDAENQELIEYAQNKGRLACSLGADAYNEFISTVLNTKKYGDFVSHQIMRREEHYPIFAYTNELLEAKEHVSGYQMSIAGTYSNLIEYDLESSYPAQLLCDTPCGMPKYYNYIEDVPITYFKIITFSFFNCQLKPNKIAFVNVGCIGEITLTERMFELFQENYNASIKIKKITAFKTQKSPFRKFITDNIINGKKNEPRKHIAKYNKYIGNSIIGYFGRNTTTIENTAKLNDLGIETSSVDKTIDPIYLPVYLCVLDRAKSTFIRTIQKHQNKIVYANTDGFLSTEPIDTQSLNANNSLSIGNYRPKHTYSYIYIECINGYAGILDTGELDNTISGMTLERMLEPDEYRHRTFEYYVHTPTPQGTIKKQIIKPHQ